MSDCGRPRAPKPAARATRWGRCSRPSKATTPGSRRSAAISRRRVPTSSEVEPFRLPSGNSIQRVRRLPRGPPATCGGTPRITTSRCCRCTTSGTRASAASRARRPARSEQPPLGTLAGPEARVRDPYPTNKAVASAFRRTFDVRLRAVTGYVRLSFVSILVAGGDARR